MRSSLQIVSMLWQSFLFSTILPQLAYGHQSNESCLTPACIKAAAHVLENLHPNYQEIDPCDNFEQFVCGGFPAQNALAEEPDVLGLAGASNLYNLRSILEGPYPHSNSTSNPDDKAAFDLVVKNYQSCMNATAKTPSDIDISGITAIVQQISTRFPVNITSDGSNVTLKDSDYDELADTLAYLTQVGVPVFGNFWTYPDPQLPDSMIPLFGPNFYNLTDQTLPAQISISELSQQPVGKLAITLKQVLPNSTSNAIVSLLAENVRSFAAKVVEIETVTLLDTSQSLKAFYYSTTVAEASRFAPALVLDKVIQKLAPPSYKLDRMVFQYPDIYANISVVVASTPKSTLQAVMMIMAYESYAKFLPQLPATGLSDDRWSVCYPYVDKSLPWIASKFFLDAHYNEEARKEFIAQTVELKAAFLKRVENLEWMTNATKALVKEKISKVKTLVGYPDENPNARNSTDLLRYYSPINITSSFFNNALSIRQWAAQRQWQTLLVPVDTSKWQEYMVHSYAPNARYNANFNNMQLPAGISQSPVYVQGAPSYLAYGGIGMISGHEITHGFDNNGRAWNQNTQYKEWWDKTSVAEFNNRTDCFIKQFSNIPAVDLRGRPVVNATGQPVYVMGAKTLAENLADAGGLGNAWDAWRLHEAKSPSQRLPGLGFTKEQLFFIAAGQTWCSALTAKAMLATVETNTHAPPFARILNIQKNSAPFREAWQCKERKPECQLW